MSEATTTLKERFEKEYWFWDKRYERNDVISEIKGWIREIQVRFSVDDCPIYCISGHYTEDFLLKISVFDWKTKSLTKKIQWEDFYVYGLKNKWTVIINNENYEIGREECENDDALRDYLFKEVMSTLEGFQISY